MGSVYARLYDYPNALKYNQKSYNINLQLGNKAGMAATLYWIGNIYFTAHDSTLITMGIFPKERLSKAIEKFTRSLQIGKEIGALDLQREALERLSIVYEKQKNIVKAYETYKNYIIVSDSILNEDKKRELMQKEFQYEYGKKENQIKLLSTQNKLKSALADKENQKKNFAYSGIGAILLAGGYGFLRYKKRKTLQDQQALMNERLRISRELHDEVGATLSGIAMYSHLTKEQIKSVKHY